MTVRTESSKTDRRPRRRLSAWAAAAIAPLCLATGCAPAAPTFDLVIANGRVMDPETGLDATRNVGITHGVIAEISARNLRGRENIDAKGLVVSPGFIDVHAHGQDFFAYRLQAEDGVTSSLELEEGVYPVTGWYQHRAGKAPINYGATVSYMYAKALAFGAIGVGDLASYEYEIPAKLIADPSWREAMATPAQQRQTLTLVKQGLHEGGLGIGFNLAETPGISPPQLRDFFNLGGAAKVPVFVHIRSPDKTPPLDAAREVVADAQASGASLHICHVNSSGLLQTRQLVDLVTSAQRNGVNVSTEVYPYTAASTEIGAPHVSKGGLALTGSTFHDLEWVATGERLTEQTFDAYRKSDPAGIIIAHIMRDSDVDYAVASPNVMIASDQMRYIQGRGHPRGAGTHARILGLYVREKKVLTLMSALNKMTLLPARQLEAVTPQMKMRGRVQKGMIADLTIFDPATVTDNATFANPAAPSSGIVYVLLHGQKVVDHNHFVEQAHSGVAIRSQAGGDAEVAARP